jgi:hypothetical protein
LLVKEKVFLNRTLYQEAERHYSLGKRAAAPGGESLRCELNKVREQIKNSLSEDSHETIEVSALLDRLNLVESENKQLKDLVGKLESRLAKLEGGKPAAAAPAAKAAAPAAKAAAPAKKDDDDIDLFGESDDEDSEEKQRIREERLKAYADKKSTSIYTNQFIFHTFCLTRPQILLRFQITLIQL